MESALAFLCRSIVCGTLDWKDVQMCLSSQVHFADMLQDSEGVIPGRKNHRLFKKGTAWLE